MYPLSWVVMGVLIALGTGSYRVLDSDTNKVLDM